MQMIFFPNSQLIMQMLILLTEMHQNVRLLPKHYNVNTIKYQWLKYLDYD